MPETETDVSSNVVHRRIENIPTQRNAYQWDGTKEGAEALAKILKNATGHEVTVHYPGSTIPRVNLHVGDVIVRLLEGSWVTHGDEPELWDVSEISNYSIDEFYREVEGGK